MKPDGTITVFANGCFDILHAGHVTILQFARALGHRLVVGLNSDESIRKLKGPTRPIIPVKERRFMLLALGCVDEVEVFADQRPLYLIKRLRPDIYVRGPEYNHINSPESDLVISLGGRVSSPPEKVITTSTSEIIRTIRTRYQA